MVGWCISPYMLPGYGRVVYTSLYASYTLLDIPPSSIHCWSLYYTPVVQQRVSGNEALGSDLRIIRDNEAQRAFQPPRV